MCTLTFLVDENVPDSVSNFLEGRGHQVLKVREYLLPGTPDIAVAAAGDEIGAALVSADNDFKRIATRIPRGHRQKFRRLSRISLTCSAPEVLPRLKAEIEMIEYRFKLASNKSDKRVLVEIGSSVLRFY